MVQNKEKHHIIPYTTLATVLIALVILTGTTVMASRNDFGPLNVCIALFIASTKASLVLMFFMHLKYESRLLQVSFVSTIIILAIFVGFIFWDVGYR